MHQGCLRYGQSQSHLDARVRPVAQAQHRPILLSSNYRNPMPAKVLAKQPIATCQKMVHPQKAVTSPRGTLLPREVTQVEDRVPRSPSSVSSMPSASMKAGRSGYHSPQEMHPDVLSAGTSRREAVVETHDKISGSSPSHLTNTCSTSASSLPLGSLREKLRELLPKDLQQDTPSAKTVAEPNAGVVVPGVGEVQMELRKEQTSREALEHKVQDLESRLNHALTSMSQVTEARHATDSATDAMLNALRRGVEEISDRCGTLEAQKENGEGTTLERFRETEAKFNEMLRKMEVTLNSEDTCQDLVVAVKTLQSQFQILQAEKRQVAEGLNAMGQKQHLIEQMQLEIREKIQQVAPVDHLQQMESTLTQLQGQQRELSASVQGLLNMYQACPEHVGSMDKVAVAALIQPIQKTQQQQAQELSNFKVMLEEMKGENSEAKAARREVATVADALSMLCSKVDELSNATNDTVDLGALSKTLAALTERVEQMEGKGHVTVEAAAPTPSSASSSRGALGPRVPSPRRWLQEPLFVSVGRKSDVPGILQSTDQLLSRPSTSVLR